MKRKLTHTLTWSVTIALGSCYINVSISTHTLTWSVTIVLFLRYSSAIISTHTLTWSVTCQKQLHTSHKQNFNSHAHVERDPCPGSRKHFHLHFNSHAHVERDMRSKNDSNAHVHFNSHAHVERDMFNDVVKIAKAISTHTLTWSVTAVKFS